MIEGRKEGEKEGRKESDEMMSGSDGAMKNYSTGWSDRVQVGAGLCAVLGEEIQEGLSGP